MKANKHTMANHKTLVIGLLGLLVTMLLVVGAALYGGQRIATNSSIQNAVTRVSGNEGVINGIAVPPEPDPALNDATLAGVDSNNNGVRDDVERMIAREFGDSTSKYQEVMRFAAAEQRVITDGNPNARDSYTNFIDCALDRGFVSSEDLDETTNTVLNTPARRGAEGRTLAGATFEDCKEEPSTSEVINGISVPPEPNPVINNATLAGVDSNQNGVRDDVERFIAERYGHNQIAMKGAMESARGHQMILLANMESRDSAQAALRSSISAGVCAARVFTASGLNATEELNQTFSRTYDTPERLSYKASISAIAGVFPQSVTAIACD